MDTAIHSTAIVARAAAHGPVAKATSQSDVVRALGFAHRALRGRYAAAAILTLAVGAGGAVAGWVIGQPTYRSEGLLRIAYALPEVMQETDQNKPMAQYDAFMLSQRMLITSQRVIDVAASDPIWKSMGLTAPEKADRYFAEHLAVDTKP